MKRTRVIEWPVVVCLMIMTSGATVMTLGRPVVGGAVLFPALIVGAVLRSHYDHRP